jgi:hypothetical protein
VLLRCSSEKERNKQGKGEGKEKIRRNTVELDYNVMKGPEYFVSL